MISRAVKNHSHYKKRLEALGFPGVTLTALEKDALNSLIRNTKPNLVMMGARFYQGCTPFLMKELKQTFPKVKMAALCVGEYPADLAMYFILNGINSYITTFEGIDKWYEGLEEVSRGREYISPDVIERIDLRSGYPFPAGNITDRHIEVIRLICCGYKDLDIADVLHISRSTVDNHKTEIFTTLNVRNSNELIRAALYLKLVSLEEIHFFPKDFMLNPKIDKKLQAAASIPPTTIRRVK